MKSLLKISNTFMIIQAIACCLSVYWGNYSVAVTWSLGFAMSLFTTVILAFEIEDNEETEKEN